MGRKTIDLTNQTFGRLTVIKRVENGEYNHAMWLCKCDCSNDAYKVISSANLRNGTTQSCGCLQKELASKRGKLLKRKYNTYDLSNEFGIGYDNNDNKFYFDLENYDKIKIYCWNMNSNDYICSKIDDKIITLHRFIMDFPDNMEVDHINRIRYDNRKQNLRIVTSQQNSMNRSLQPNNTSGIIGVHLNKNNKWVAQIMLNRKTNYLGSFSNKKDAVIERLKAEKEYFGEEFAPQRHLFKQYGI